MDILKHIERQSQEICVDKKNLNKSLHILEDDASGDIEQVIVKFSLNKI